MNNRAASLNHFLHSPALDSAASLNITADSHRKALSLFHQAAARVPAYSEFLATHGINPSRITTFDDFLLLPPTTKTNYIEKYSPEELCWDGDLSAMHMVSTSSGTTGEPHFWPRDVQTEIDGALLHAYIFTKVLGMDTHKTLFINGFALGNWIAGTFTSTCVTLNSWQGLPVTLTSPGYNADAIFQIIDHLSSKFTQTVITGHTPFLKEIVEQGASRGIKWARFNTNLLGTGQAVTENWRDYINEILGTPQGENRVFNLYGSADAALMGFESSASITFRRFLYTNPQLSQTLFRHDRIPSIYHFDPRLTLFEAIADQLHVTKHAGIPLIRYNMLDEGGVILPSQIEQQLEFKFSHHDIVHLPFIYLFGRDKFMVKIYGANIYSEHVQQALNHPNLQSYLTGRFITEIASDSTHNQQLVCRVELSKQNPVVPESVVRLIETTFIDELVKINKEYQFVVSTMGDKVRPHIIVHSHGDPAYFPTDKIKKTA